MNAQQLYDFIIKPTHEYMGDNYASKDANFLSLCTAAIESNCGHYIKQIGGPALGIWQMEPLTNKDIYENCDCLWAGSDMMNNLDEIDLFDVTKDLDESMALSPAYACAMARLKYAMDPEPLPGRNNIRAVYDYYKRIYNTPAGASTYEKFKQALHANKVFEVAL